MKPVAGDKYTRILNHAEGVDKVTSIHFGVTIHTMASSEDIKNYIKNKNTYGILYRIFILVATKVVRTNFQCKVSRPNQNRSLQKIVSKVYLQCKRLYKIDDRDFVERHPSIPRLKNT